MSESQSEEKIKKQIGGIAMNILERQIKELQEENKRLEERYVRRKEIYNKLIQEQNYRIDRAVEYIEEKGRLKYKPEELLDILERKNKWKN